VADVVASVADERHADAGEPAEPLADRHRVGERLAGVEVVGQPVDHRDRGVRRQLLDDRVLERTDDDGVEVGGEDERGVPEALAPPELELVAAERQRRPAQVGHRRGEADPRPRRRLVEHEPERLRLELAVRHTPPMARLQEVGEVEHGRQLVRAPVADPQEMPTLEVDGNHAKILAFR
jgi:hypothetical protein